MAAPATVNDFLQLLRESGLVESAAIDERLRGWETGPGLPGQPRELAERLAKEGLLTPFQAEQLLQGHWRGFTVGKYRILKQLGGGSGGYVFLCEHPGMGRRVAVKVLPFPSDPRTSTVERFRREARALATIDHPNVIHIHDFDQDGSKLFLVMEYIEGTSLRSYVKSAGRLDARRAAHVIRQAARGLQAIHEAGLVHRDVKPGNMMLDARGAVKILDLGLARFLDEDAESLTVKFDNGRVLGTPEYLSPEQALNSHEVDARSDVYSLGATFYFCLTGQPPLPAGTVAEKLLWVQSRRPQPILELNPDAPPPLVELVERMMARDPADRPQQPSEVANALAPWTQAPLEPSQWGSPPPKVPARSGPVSARPDRNPQTTHVGSRAGRVTHTVHKRPTHAGIEARPTRDPRWIDNTLVPPKMGPAAPPRSLASRLFEVFMVLLTVVVSIVAGVAISWSLASRWF